MLSLLLWLAEFRLGLLLRLWNAGFVLGLLLWLWNADLASSLEKILTTNTLPVNVWAHLVI